MGETRKALVHLIVGTGVSWSVAWLLSGSVELNSPLQLVLGLALVMAVVGCLLTALADRLFGLAAGLAVVAYGVVRLALTADGSPALVPSGLAVATEAALLFLLALLARRLIRRVTRLEESLALEAVPEFSPFVERTDLVKDLAQQQFRIAMRHGRALSVAILRPSPSSRPPASGPAKSELGRRVEELHELGRLAQVAAKTFRCTDIVMKAQDEGMLILVYPETGPESAQRLAEKAVLAAEETLEMRVDFGVASFPEEALNLEELVHHAYLKLDAQGPLTEQRRHFGGRHG